MSDEISGESTHAEEPALDPAQAEYLRNRLLSEQNLLAGALGGIVASIGGAAAWAMVTVVTGYQIGFMAIGVGLLVGYAVRFLGKGITPPFGIVGGALALVGCAVGNLLAVTAIIAGNDDVPLLEALTQLTPALSWDLMVAFFSPMDLLFYAIAVYEDYKLSFRQISQQELGEILAGSTGPVA